MQNIIAIVVPSAALLMVFVAVVQVAVKFSGRNDRERRERYLEEERKANFARNKDIDHTVFYTPDLSALPIREYSGEEKERFPLLYARQEKAVKCAKAKMIHFNQDISNRDLKYKYGVANLGSIAEYEENFNTYIHALLNWSEALIEAGENEEAEKALLQTLAAGSESSRSYILLADIYTKQKNKTKLAGLLAALNENSILADQKARTYIETCMASI